MRLRLGLRRLRRALRVPAVSASAIALTAASLVASTDYVVRRLVHLRHQRRVPGRRARLAHRHVRRAGAVRLGHGLLRLWRPLYVSTLDTALAAAALTAPAVATAETAAAFPIPSAATAIVASSDLTTALTATTIASTFIASSSMLTAEAAAALTAALASAA